MPSVRVVPSTDSRSFPIVRPTPRAVARVAVSASFSVLTLLLTGTIGCSTSDVDAKRVAPTYDKKTGKLEMLKFDSKGDGYFDTFSYMDGNRIVRIEIDANHDGVIDRWEYYDAEQKLVKIGASRGGDAIVDAWSYPRPDGTIERTEISAKRDGKVSRTEYFEGKALVRAEEDTDGDGKIDKWET